MVRHSDLLNRIARDFYLDLSTEVEVVEENGRKIFHEGITESYMKVQDETGKQFWIVVREA